MSRRCAWGTVPLVALVAAVASCGETESGVWSQTGNVLVR